MRKLGLSFIVCLVLFSVYSFVPNRSETNVNKINWLTWEHAMELSELEQKKIVVAIYTNWCAWCKKMDKTTFNQDHIADYVNENFYAVHFDAEQKEPIEFKGKVYNYVSPSNGKRGYHEFASAMTMGQMSYPTTVFFDEKVDLIQPIPGFQDTPTFEMIITYFGDNHYKKVPWDKYEKTFVSTNFPQIATD